MQEDADMAKVKREIDPKALELRRYIGWNLDNARHDKAHKSREEMSKLLGYKDRTAAQRIEHGEIAITTDMLYIYSRESGVDISELVIPQSNLTKKVIDELKKVPHKYEQMAVNVLNAIWRTFKADEREEERRQQEAAAEDAKRELRKKALEHYNFEKIRGDESVTQQYAHVLRGESSKRIGLETIRGADDKDILAIGARYADQETLDKLHPKQSPENRFVLLDSETVKDIPWAKDREKVLEFMEYYEQLLKDIEEYYADTRRYLGADD